MSTESLSNEDEVLFKESRTNFGWTLNVVKINNTLITTSLYDNSDKLVETKSFNLDESNELPLLKQYISLFDEDVEKNIKKMTSIKN